MAVTCAPRTAGALSLCGERFVPAQIVLLWGYEGPAGETSRGIMDLKPSARLEIIERILRRFVGGDAHYATIRRDMLRLEDVGDPLAVNGVAPCHRVMLARAYVPEYDGGRTEPIVISIGDERGFFAFGDAARARDWGRRVEQQLGRRPPWRAYPAETWPLDAARFVPRLTGDGYSHGFTDLEAELEKVLSLERRLKPKARARRR